MKGKYFYSLDLLRTVAALAVVIAHYGGMGFLFGIDHVLTKIFYSGVNGVYIFFVVSGFIIPYSLHSKKYEIKGFWRYLYKRSIRIDPPYFVAIILYVLVSLLISIHAKTDFEFSLTQFFSHFIYATPFLHEEFYDPVFWTLTVEFQFYIVMAILFGLNNEKAPFYLLMFVFLLSPTFIQGYTVFHYSPLFMFGMIAFFYRTKKIRKPYIPLLIVSCFSIHFHGSLISTIGLCTALFICFYNGSRRKFFFTIASFSYSLYLLNNLWRTFFFSNFVVAGLNLNEWTISAKLCYLIVILMLAVLLSYLFYLLIEKPCLRYSKKISLHPNTSDRNFKEIL